jgi:glycosyltransferase involved in cell wall biosynthesis
MSKILIITYYWVPSGGSGVQRWLKFVKYLPQLGWEPIVLTVDENKASYPQIDKSLAKDVPTSVRVERTSTFEILDFYKKLSPEKQIPYGGFSDEKAPSLFQKISRFIRGNFFLPDPRRGWNRYAYKRACDLIEKEGITTIVTTSPPHSTQLVGLQLKAKYPHLNWIADFRDPWTDIHYYKKLYPTIIADAINKNYERKVLEKADKVIVTCESTKEVFLSKSTILNPDKFTVITNGFDTDDFVAVKRNTTEKFTITYIGILYNTTDIKALLSAFSKMEDKEHCCLRFVGHSGIVTSEIKNRNLEAYTTILPQVKHSEAVQLMADSSVLVLLVPDKDKASSFLPGKLFEYLASRRPILGIASPDNEIRQIIAKCEAGKTFNYDDELGMLNFLSEKKKEWEMTHICEINNDNYLQFSRNELTQQLNNFIKNV